MKVYSFKMKQKFLVVLFIVVAGLASLIVWVKSRLSPAINQSQTMETVADGYEGKKIAGHQSLFLTFTQADYEEALASDKIVFLNFYANWCPICRGEETVFKAGFDFLKSDRVIGFRVNFNDSETDQAEKELAQKFGVGYQHHKIIIKKGQAVLSDPDVWSQEKFLEVINKVLAR